MLFKAKGKPLIEAKNWEEAEKTLGTKDFKAYKKPSLKAFMMWCWLRCDKKDGRLLKEMLDPKASFLKEYYDNPNIVGNELKRAHIRLSEWIMVGEQTYNKEEHSEFFYRKYENL